MQACSIDTIQCIHTRREAPRPVPPVEKKMLLAHVGKHLFLDLPQGIPVVPETPLPKQRACILTKCLNLSLNWLHSSEELHSNCPTDV